ncbi:MAG: hypothetical protein ABI895_32585, partial [Deltaproteobacteria bacterium]
GGSMKARISMSVAPCCLLAAAPAFAARPVGLVTGFERLESISHSTVSTTVAGVEQKSNAWRAGLGTGGGSSYSVPRATLEYAWESGLSIGASAGFMVSWKKRSGPNIYVLEPRVGYYFDLGEDLVLWPRVGLTLHELLGPDATHGALTLEVPLMAFRHELGSMTVGPFLDLGLGGSQGDADQSVTELGLALGFQFL